MATFPVLPVTGRTFTQGIYPHTAHSVYNGRQVRVRHSNTLVGNLLRLRFDMLSRSEMLSLQSHYAGQLGGFLAFAIPDDVLEGINTPATVTPTGHSWVYVTPPRVTDVAIDGASPSNRYVVEVELASVPPENSIVGGQRWTVRISWAPGRASAPLFWSAITLGWAPGAAYGEAPGAAWSVPVSWTPGAGPVAGAAWTVTTSWNGGDAYDANAVGDSLYLLPVWAFDPPLFLFGEDS